MGREGKSVDNAVIMKKKYMNLQVLCPVLITVMILVSGCGTLEMYEKGGEGASGPAKTEDGIRFSLYSTKAERVCIAGDFNNWSATADPLYDREGTGMWILVLPLPAGRYEYKFIIDGKKWIPDPGNEDTVNDGFGGVNSILVIE